MSDEDPSGEKSLCPFRAVRAHKGSTSLVNSLWITLPVKRLHGQENEVFTEER